jgi:hypothetical protein
MKITRTNLKNLIKETLLEQESILLEMPPGPIVGQEQEGDYTKDPDSYQGEMSKRSLYHMSQQAQQLHDMLRGDENLEPWVQAKIKKAAECLEKAFKAITYDKGPGRGRL